MNDPKWKNRRDVMFYEEKNGSIIYTGRNVDGKPAAIRDDYRGAKYEDGTVHGPHFNVGDKNNPETVRTDAHIFYQISNFASNLFNKFLSK